MAEFVKENFLLLILLIILGGAVGWLMEGLWTQIRRRHHLQKLRKAEAEKEKTIACLQQKLILQTLSEIVPESQHSFVKQEPKEVTVLTTKVEKLEKDLQTLNITKQKIIKENSGLQSELSRISRELTNLRTEIGSKGNLSTKPSKLATKRSSFDKRARRNHFEKFIGFLLFLAASVSVLTTFAVIFTLGIETIQFFADPAVSLWEFFTHRQWTPLFAESQRHFGIAPLITGTLLVTFIALVVGLPLGLGAAIYLSEFASRQVRKIFMPILEVLAGIPTIVLGYFALLVVTPLLQSFIPNLNIFNPLSAGLVMGFMILPTVSSISIDSMQAVPRHLREAAYGLGAAKYEVVGKVVVPAALSGIVAAFILAMSRAIGETMIVALAAGQKPTLTFDPRETIATMTSFIVQAATGDQPAGSLASRALFAVGATLFLITLVFNLISQQVVKRFEEKYE